MKRLGIIFGGKSDEHEISILSASSVIDAIDRTKYEVVPVAIAKDGTWYLITDSMSGIESLDDERIKTIIPGDTAGESGARSLNLTEFKDMVDFAFPVLHGPYGEDGTIQGLFEMLDIPYAGCGVTSSALSMDKIFTKEVWIRAGLPVCRHRSLNVLSEELDRDETLLDIELEDIAKDLGMPLFVKPANMGSSVGISRAVDFDGLRDAVRTASKYDRRIIIEEEIKGRELETAVLGNNKVEAAEVGEVVAAGEFYDYESKYKGGDTVIMIPANIDAKDKEQLREIAVNAFLSLDGSGFSRVDFFKEEGTGRILLNEMNTIPGFTKFSMFPTLWKEAGVPYAELIERIIDLGYERYNAKNNR